MKRAAFILFLLVTSIFYAVADVPLRTEQLIYSILAYNGRDYSGTFCGEDSDTIYLIADADNFVSVRKTFVYYWAITDELRTDTSAMNIPFKGTLVVETRGTRGARGALQRTIEMSIYTYYNVRGDYESNWMVDTGLEAINTYQKSQNEITDYYQDMETYQRQLADYNAIAGELSVKIGELRSRGEDVSSLQRQFVNLAAPAEPENPQTYTVPPVSPQIGFLFNLPVGEYDVRFVNEDGTVMETSEKRVVVFSSKRESAAGVEIIPGDRWTRSVDSRTTSSVIYVDGSTELFLRPYYQNEYVDLYYEKLVRNDSSGNPGLMRWAQIQQIPGAQIAISYGFDDATIVREQSFSIEQTSGASLGYLVVPYDPVGKHKGLDPSLQAYRLPIRDGVSRIRLQILDRDGNGITGGNREVRIISSTRWIYALLILSCIPMVAFIMVRVARSRAYIKPGEHSPPVSSS